MVRAEPDETVARVLDVWTPRFLRAGILMEDIARVAAQARTWDDWAPAWLEVAREHEELAETWLDRGDELAAADALQRSSIHYHTAAFVYFRDLDLHRHGYRKMVETYDRSIPLLGGAVEKVSFPYEDTSLVGLLSIPSGTRRPPVVILVPGLDSTKETRHRGRSGFLARGMAVLSIDGPGQGEMSETTYIRPDYEVVVAAAIDYLETRADLDATRVGLVGSSLGGYYAPRAAAREPRVRACVAVSGPFNWGWGFRDLPSVTREAFQHYSGVADEEAAEQFAGSLTLEDCAHDLRCPLMVVAGRKDPLVGWESGQRLHDAATGAKEIHVFDEGNHSCQNIPHKVLPLQYLFLSEHLARRP